MKSLAFTLLLCAAGLAHSQGTTKPPAVPSNPFQLFQTPPLQTPGTPQFKWRDPDPSHRFFVLPPSAVHTPTVNLDIDRGILREPQGFARHPSRPAPRGDLYPGLKIQPTEIAKLEGFSAYPGLKTAPIPRLFPKAKLEPIPITWDKFHMTPIETGQFSNP
jgi:hypothetical protein